MTIMMISHLPLKKQDEMRFEKNNFYKQLLHNNSRHFAFLSLKLKKKSVIQITD